MENLQKTIKGNWKPKSSNQSYVIKTKFSIDRSGNIHDIELLNKHTDKDINEAAIQAIKKSKIASFDEIKSLGESKNISIEFTFDYKVSKIQKEAQQKPTPEKPTEKIETNLYKDSVLSSKDNQKAEAANPLKNILKILLFLVFIFWNLFFRARKKPNPRNFNIQNKKPQFDQYYDPTDVKR
jgi:hypothetical protein